MLRLKQCRRDLVVAFLEENLSGTRIGPADGSLAVKCTIECLDSAFPCCSETLSEYEGLVLEDLIEEDGCVQPDKLQVLFPKTTPHLPSSSSQEDPPLPSPPLRSPPTAPPPSPQAPDSPNAGEKNDETSIGTSTEEEPDWLRLPVSFPVRPPLNTTVMWNDNADLVIRGVFPPDQIRTLARQTTNVLTIDDKLVRVFLMRGWVRIGPLSLDLTSWDAETMTYNATGKDTVRSLAPFRLRVEEGSIVRFHRARREAFNRR